MHSTAPLPEGKTLPRDRIGWTVRPIPTRIVAVGDIHGDLSGLLCILRDRKLVTKKGRWNGEDTHLVLTGDLTGPEDALILSEFLMKLEKKAAASGGAVHVLIGNNDIRVLARGRDGAPFADDSKPAIWLRRRNAVIRVGRTIFTHAGLNTWAFRHHPARVNATIRAWIRFWQGVGDEPDVQTQWVVSGRDVRWEHLSTGPLWTKSYKIKKKRRATTLKPRSSNAPDANQLSRILRRFRVDRMVIGHTAAGDRRVQLVHPYYGPQVIMIDTRIADRKRGRLSCIEITGDDVKAHYPERKPIGDKIAERVRRRLQAT